MKALIRSDWILYGSGLHGIKGQFDVSWIYLPVFSSKVAQLYGNEGIGVIRIRIIIIRRWEKWLQ